MNIEHRDEFEALLQDLRQARVVAVDTETNGLLVYQGHRPISMSFYFPEVGRSYNFAWSHGEGEIHVPQAYRNLSRFHDWAWTGKGKKQAYKKYWWALFQDTMDFGNTPRGWLDELRLVWNTAVATPDLHVVYFNAPFDIHMMEAIGFNQPASTEDVFIAVHLVFEDWNHPAVRGEFGLKWQAAYHQIEGALDGENDLREQAGILSGLLAKFIAEHWEDPMNRSFHALKRPARVDEIAKRVAIDPKSEMWMLPSWAVARYAEADTVLTWKLREHLRGILRQWHQVALYETLCAAQAQVALRMEKNGILLDRARAGELMKEMEPLMEAENAWFRAELEKRWDTLDEETQRALSDHKGRLTFSLTSNTRLPHALAAITGKPWKKADKEALEAFEAQYGHSEAVERVRKFRNAQRAVSTYLKNWMASQDEDGHIHFSFNVVGTKTGRWSSSSGTLGETGNGQNIPSRGFRIKEALVTPPGWMMFQMDYSQIELRLAAMIAQCHTMIRLFNSGEDMHAYTRDRAGVRDILFPGMTLDQQVERLREIGKLKGEPQSEAEAEAAVLDYSRFVAKTLNFGLLYSGTWRMVSRLLKLEEEPARLLHRAWNDLYPEFAEANEEWTRQALTRRPRPDGSGRSLLYVVQPFSGRTRKLGFYPISHTYWDSDTGERRVINPREIAAKDAFNFAVQGGASYIMTVSALRVSQQLSNDIFRPFAIIHDSLNFYLRQDAVGALPDIRRTMIDWPTNPRLDVSVEYAIDGRWQNIKEITDLDAFVGSAGRSGYKGAA